MYDEEAGYAVGIAYKQGKDAGQASAKAAGGAGGGAGAGAGGSVAELEPCAWEEYLSDDGETYYSDGTNSVWEGEGARVGRGKVSGRLG